MSTLDYRYAVTHEFGPPRVTLQFRTPELKRAYDWTVWLSRHRRALEIT